MNLLQNRHKLPDEDEDIRISKSLLRLLRHAAYSNNLRPMAGGFLFLDDVLEDRSLKAVDPGRIRHIVTNDDRNRFTLEKDVESGREKIRANYGHTMPIELTDEDVHHRLYAVLNYTAEKDGLDVMDGGFVYVDEMLSSRRFSNVKLEQIKRVARSNENIGTQCDLENGRLKIRYQSDEDIRIRKRLNNILRHRFQRNLKYLRPMISGFLFLDDVLRHESFKGMNPGKIVQVAKIDKMRFTLEKDVQTGREKIRANFGHTMPIKLTDENVQELLVRALKYTEEIYELELKEGGFLYVDELLETFRFRNVNLDHIKSVASSAKDIETQFDSGNGRLKIRLLSAEYIKLSKRLNRLLRHEAYDLDLEPMTGGFLFLDDVLGGKMFKGVNPSMIRQIASDDRKKFTLERDFETGREKIRANYGHSIYIELSDEDVKQLLFTVLKHTYEICDLELMDGGFLYVDEILKTHSFSNVKLEQIQRVVRRKNQLETQSEFGSGRLRIRLLSSPNDDIKVLSAEKEDYRIIKSLTRLLRHDAYSYNLRPMTEGFLFLDDVLCVKSLKGVNPEKMRQIVRNDKIKFTLEKDVETGRDKIRANYGHSMPIVLTDEHVQGLLFKALNNPANMEEKEDGFLCVEHLLNTYGFRNVELDQIKDVVGKSEEFELQSDLETERLKIRIKL